MAASMNWRQFLNHHKLFATLRKNLEKVKLENESKDILNVHDGELFVWNAYNSSILTTNIKLLVGKNETESAETSFQTLLCTNPPTYDVSRLSFSPSGSYLAVIGRKGLSVIDLPQKWGKYAEYEGGKERILCKTIPVAERYFLSTHESLLVAEWHPGSDNDMYLVLLMSDNTVRIYNLQNPQSPEQTFHLGEGGVVSPNRLRTQPALGESAVSLDFGPPIELQSKKRYGQSKITDDDGRSYVWPVYLLWGNGDVYVLNTTVGAKRKIREELVGPLSMYPPAEDNYGTDACSICCLYTRPPTLVIATSEGKLHHCVLLSSNDGDDTKSELSMTSDSTIYEATVSTQRLYVYETVELELSLATISIAPDDTITDEFSCPIRIHKDSSCGDRYHCSHSAGIHTVALPWQQKIQEFCEEVEGVDPPLLSENEHSIVEHLVCTKPLPSNPACPVLGLCMTADRLLGTNLICLTNTLECLVLPLVNNHKTPAPQLLSSGPSKSVASPLRQMHRESFDVHIQKILHRTSSNPLLKTSSRTDLSPQECFQLLSRATQVFREEYVQKQDLAREEIAKRVRILREHKELHLSDLRDCQQNKAELRQNAETLAERYEDAKDKQEDILHRIEAVLKKIQSKLPVLTAAEKNMQRELKQMEEKLNIYKTNIQQLNNKMDYQKRQIAAQCSSGVNPAFSKTQTQQLRTVLKQEGEEISDLVKEINSLKLALDT